LEKRFCNYRTIASIASKSVKYTVAGNGINLFAVANGADKSTIFQADNGVGCFNFFQPQFAIALAATDRRKRLDKGAHRTCNADTGD
jgi:hypothetical protein